LRKMYRREKNAANARPRPGTGLQREPPLNPAAGTRFVH
jgi:hypothetical protein